MYIENVAQLSSKSIFDRELFEELADLEDEFEKEEKRRELVARAGELGVKTDFNKALKAFEKTEKSQIQVIGTPQYFLNFTGEDTSLSCGSWQATDDGIFTLTDKGRLYACLHPIYPVKVLVNAETRQCKIELRYKVRNSWRNITVDKSIIASRNKIISLADNGIMVTSENADALVKYLSDVEALNPFDVYEQISTSKLGWIGNDFMPYGKDILFDNATSLMPLFNSINQCGSRDAWLKTMLKVRKDKRFEVLIYCAASFASVLVGPCDALPFIVSLWGGSGKGKTVSMQLATSIWADPSEGKYIADAKATITAMEIKLDTLNSLPMALDDLAQVKDKYDGDFSSLIYWLCQGMGRERSNQNLGLNKLTSWRNCILTNGENSLVTESTQGGAVNRVIDVEIDGDSIFNDGGKIVSSIKNNYGFAGKEFIEYIQRVGFDEVKNLVDSYKKELKTMSELRNQPKENKQIMPMALILAADELSEKAIYKDGVRLDLNRCFDILKNPDDISESKRAYEYIVSSISANRSKFNEFTDYSETWGKEINPKSYGFDVEGEWYAILGHRFDNIIKESGFESKSFFSWAKKEGLLMPAKDGYKKVVTVNGIKSRCVVLRMPEESSKIAVSEDMDNPFI